MATVTLDAGEFYYTSYGDPAGMPLVLLHGMPSDGSTWEQVAPGLAATGYRLITPDQRGHGRASFDPGPRPDGGLPYDWAVMPAILGQLNRPDPAWWSDLPAITAPTLVIGGGSTSPAPQHLLAKLADLVPGAELVTIEGAGHAVHRTRPTEFLATAGCFLRRIRTGKGDEPGGRGGQSPEQ